MYFANKNGDNSGDDFVRSMIVKQWKYAELDVWNFTLENVKHITEIRAQVIKHKNNIRYKADPQNQRNLPTVHTRWIMIYQQFKGLST